MNDPKLILDQINEMLLHSGMSDWDVSKHTSFTRQVVKSIRLQLNSPSIAAVCELCELLDLEITVKSRKDISNIPSKQKINLEI